MNYEAVRWGWNVYTQHHFTDLKETGKKHGRVVSISKHMYCIVVGGAMRQAVVSGACTYAADSRADYPAVGDWVVCREAFVEPVIIERVLPRYSTLSRSAAGEPARQQVIAANIDLTALVFGIDGGRNFSAGALERYLIAARSCGMRTLILLNKADTASESKRHQMHLRAVNSAPGAEVLLISARTGMGLDNLKFLPHETVALIGPSGVGKSTLINRLAGKDLRPTAPQRSSDLRGRHTTSSRDLFLLENGLLIIDTPGMREFKLWSDGQGADDAFSDIVRLSQECRFSDCSHQGEPGCAIQAALFTGELEYRRYENYLVLKQELARLDTRRKEKVSRSRGSRGKQLKHQK